jgi:hypothetical protein
LTAKGLASLMALPTDHGRTLAFSLGTQNSFVVLPFALSLPVGWEVAAVVIVVQSMVELSRCLECRPGARTKFIKQGFDLFAAQHPDITKSGAPVGADQRVLRHGARGMTFCDDPRPIQAKACGPLRGVPHGDYQPSLAGKSFRYFQRRSYLGGQVLDRKRLLDEMHAAQSAAVLSPRFQENIATTACRFSLPAPVSGNSVAGRMCLGVL